MSFQTAFQSDAFQNDAFQIYSNFTGRAVVGITEVATVYAKVSIMESVPVYANTGIIVPGSSSPAVYANVSIFET